MSNITANEFHQWWRVLYKEGKRRDALSQNHKALFSWKNLGYSPEEASNWFLSYDTNIIKKLDKYKKASLSFSIAKEAIKNNWSVSKTISVNKKNIQIIKDRKEKLVKNIKKHCTNKPFEYNGLSAGMLTPYSIMDKCVIVKGMIMKQSLSKNKGLYQMTYLGQPVQGYIEIIFKETAPRYFDNAIIVKIIDTDVLNDNTRIPIGKQFFTID